MCWLTGASQVALLVLENEVPLVARDEDCLDSRGGDHLVFGTIGLGTSGCPR